METVFYLNTDMIYVIILAFHGEFNANIPAWIDMILVMSRGTYKIISSISRYSRFWLLKLSTNQEFCQMVNNDKTVRIGISTYLLRMPHKKRCIKNTKNVCFEIARVRKAKFLKPMMWIGSAFISVCGSGSRSRK